MNIKRLLSCCAAITASIGTSIAQTYYVSTVAGGLPTGFLDATGTVARFNHPYAVAVDGSGFLYVADSSNQTIRKITPDGVVTTLAGRPLSPGSADGVGSDARFRYPQGIAVDQQGVIYVADTGNSTIRKVTADGVVTTFAGMAGVAGNVDGIGAEASLNTPWGMRFDGSGSLYVANNGDSRIRIVTTNGLVTTLTNAIDGTALFSDPRGLALDAAGNIYVVGGVGHIINKAMREGIVTTFAGKFYANGSADGMGSEARFGTVNDIAIDSAENLYVADGNNTIRKVSLAGVVTTIAGIADYFSGSNDGIGSAARFADPSGIAVDKAGNIYVADEGNNMIRKLTPIFPALQISRMGLNVAVSWPTSATNSVLQAGASLDSATTWTSITNNISTNANNLIHTVSPTNSAQYFRLRTP